jgi:hypothetical protein
MLDLVSVVFSTERVFLLFLLFAGCVGNVNGAGVGGSGIIPYTLKNGRAYVFLGQDSWTMTWSNFGGGYDKGKDKTLEDTAAREGFEETMGVFLSRKNEILILKRTSLLE